MKTKTVILFLSIILISCVSTKGLGLVKGKTTLERVKVMYNDETQNQSITFNKSYTSKTSGKTYDVYTVTENGLNNEAKTVAGQILNQTTRYLVFNSEDIYVDTVQNPFNIQKQIDKL